jgi:hypothetical protein
VSPRWSRNLTVEGTAAKIESSAVPSAEWAVQLPKANVNAAGVPAVGNVLNVG